MPAFIFWTGSASILAGIAFQSTAVIGLLPATEPGMLTHFFGLMAIFIGITLVACSRDLPNRAPIVMWEGALRLVGSVVVAAYGLRMDGGNVIVAGAVFDLVVGALHLVGLPRHLAASPIDLLLDRAGRAAKAGERAV